MIEHNLRPIPLTGDIALLLIGVAVFCVVMIVLSVIGFITERRRAKTVHAVALADEQRDIALNSVLLPNFTTEQIRTAADTNSRRALARDTKKGSTHE